jgi:hypothetical protein
VALAAWDDDLTALVRAEGFTSVTAGVYRTGSLNDALVAPRRLA